MTDVTVGETGAATPKDLIITVKLKGDAGEVSLNISTLPDEAYQAIVQAGAEAFIHKANGATKAITGVTKASGEDLAERQKVIREAAEKTKEQLEAGIVPGASRKGPKASGAEAIEAMRLAKMMLKDLIRASGQKIGAYSAKEQTAAAKVILERNPDLLELAKKNIAQRAADAKGVKALDLKGLFGAKADSEEVKAKPKKPPAKAKKANDGKPTLSAATAGKAKPKAQPSATAH
jgi:hypothetical protein